MALEVRFRSRGAVRRQALRIFIASAVILLANAFLFAAESAPCTGAKAKPADAYFVDEVWAKVGERNCLTCHKAGGEAADSRFVLLDPQRSQGAERVEALCRNRDAFARMALLITDKQSVLLQKVVGGLDHGGDVVLEKNSTGYRVLEDFVKRTLTAANSAPAATAPTEINARPFFEGVAMISDLRLLRRLTLSLTGRLPTEAEQAAVKAGGLKAIDGVMDQLLKEDAFYLRLREAYEDIFLTSGTEDVPEEVLAYRYFGSTFVWYQKFNLDHIKDEKARKEARYKLTREYRKALLEEPLKLIEHIVRNDHPYSEIVTADYIMVTPYTARGYGIFEDIRSRFKNPEDPFEFIPIKLKALESKQPTDKQLSATGFYPHAGVLSTFQYLNRYKTTETNRNRLRTRMYYEHFLGVDLLELADRVSDAAAVSSKYENPTMQAAECVVCHRTLDPVAGLFQEYRDFEGTYGNKRKEGWYKDMFEPGFEGEDLPKEETWRALQWLGERTVKDPRFATAMVGHAYYILTGRKPLVPPKDLEDPLYPAKRRAYVEQRRMIEEIAQRFSRGGFNFKQVLKDLAKSDFYRADHLQTAAIDPQRQAELSDVGVARMLSPEQLERKINAIFGKPWGKLKEDWAMLYGGIDSRLVTERATDPSGALGAIQRIMANDVAALNTLSDFALPPKERRLFPEIEPDVLPGKAPADDLAIRRAIVHLHRLVLGREDAPDSAAVDRTFELFSGSVADAHAQKSFEKLEIYYARNRVTNAPADPHYTIRAWRGVVTYLLRQQDFLYE